MTTPARELYDLVIFGIDPEAADPEAAVARVAELLGIEPEEVEDALAFGSRVVGSGLTAEDAQAHFATLRALGVQCNLRPDSGSGRTLSLQAMSLERAIACPRCAHENAYQHDELPPEVCASCGLVFAKYDKVQAEAAEREQIRRSLLAQKAHLEQEDARDRREREAAERRARIEEELRRELGIPRSIASRKGLLLLASGVLAVGIGVGVGSTMLLRALDGSADDAAVPLTASTAGAEDDDTPAGTGNPGLDAHRLLARLDAAPSRDAATPGDMAALVAPRATPAGNLEALKSDALHERDLANRTDALLASGKATHAQALIAQASDRSRAIRALADAAVRRARLGGAGTDVAPTFELLAAAVDELPADSPTRVADLGHVVRGQIGAGLADAGAAQVEKVRQWAGAVADPAARVAAQGVLADLLARLGNRDDAARAYTAANEGLARIGDRAARVSAVVQLARSHADAGSIGTAALLVEDATLSAARIPDPARRAAALREIALFHGDQGNAMAALMVTATIDNASVRADIELSLAESLLAAGRVAAATEVADVITVPAFRARALGRLAVGQHEGGNALFRDLAPRTLQLARAEADRVQAPADQVIVLAELARAAHAVGDAATAAGFFAEAERVTAAIDAPEVRNPVLGVIAGNLARAGRIDDARRIAGGITDTAATVTVTDDVARVQQAMQILQQAEAEATAPLPAPVDAGPAAQGAATPAAPATPPARAATPGR